jgi:glutathione S-transferase
MQLHWCPQTRAFTALWMMEELGEPYERVRVDIRAPGHPSTAYRRINPMGKVPALVDGDCAMGETAAILLYLADKFPGARLAPAPTDPRRGRFLQWLLFTPSTLEPVWSEKQRGAAPNSFSAGWGDYDRAMNALEAALAPGPWLFGEQFTAADLYLASALGFGMRFGMADKRTRFVDFAARAEAREAFRRATEIEAQG